MWQLLLVCDLLLFLSSTYIFLHVNALLISSFYLLFLSLIVIRFISTVLFAYTFFRTNVLLLIVVLYQMTSILVVAICMRNEMMFKYGKVIWSSFICIGISTLVVQWRMKLRDDDKYEDGISKGQHLWHRSKWRTLTERWHKSTSTSMFSCLLQLYGKYPDAVETLVGEGEREPRVFEFYVPQLCTFLILGAEKEAPSLCRLLLHTCQR